MVAFCVIDSLPKYFAVKPDLREGGAAAPRDHLHGLRAISDSGKDKVVDLNINNMNAAKGGIAGDNPADWGNDKEAVKGGEEDKEGACAAGWEGEIEMGGSDNTNIAIGGDGGRQDFLTLFGDFGWPWFGCAQHLHCESEPSVKYPQASIEATWCCLP